jgi:hypothetical protein
VLVASTNPNQPMILRIALPRWQWSSFREMAKEWESECSLVESRGMLWRWFDLHGTLMFLFDLREVLLLSGLRSELREPE